MPLELVNTPPAWNTYFYSLSAATRISAGRLITTVMVVLTHARVDEAGNWVDNSQESVTFPITDLEQFGIDNPAYADLVMSVYASLGGLVDKVNKDNGLM